MAEILTDSEIAEIETDCRASSLVAAVPRLVESHRALAAERDNDVRNRQHCEDEVYELRQRLKVKTDLLDKAMAQICAENTAKIGLESRIRTFESACDAALTYAKAYKFSSASPNSERARLAIIKQLEGAIKHG